MRAEYLLTLSFAEGKLRLRTVADLSRGISSESGWGLWPSENQNHVAPALHRL